MSIEVSLNFQGENTEKYKIFSVPIEKEVTKIDKEGNENVATISCKTKLIDSERFMVSSLSSLVDNFTRGIQLNVNIVIVFLKMKVSRTI